MWFTSPLGYLQTQIGNQKFSSIAKLARKSCETTDSIKSHFVYVFGLLAK